MRENHRVIRTHSLWVYFVLSYGLSWLIFIPLALQGQGFVSGIPLWVHLFGAFGPMLAAVLTTLLFSGVPGLKELFSRVIRWRIRVIWLLLALLCPVLLFLLIASFFGLLLNNWDVLTQFGRITELPGISGITGWLIWILTFSLVEEIGWRRFALHRLQHRYHARKDSLLLGSVWTAWHIPTIIYNYSPTLFGIAAFFIRTLSGSALLIWLYNSTHGRVFASILWHGTFNSTAAGTEGIIPAILSGAVILAVIWIARRYGPVSLPNHPRHIIQDQDNNQETRFA